MALLETHACASMDIRCKTPGQPAGHTDSKQDAQERLIIHTACCTPQGCVKCKHISIADSARPAARQFESDWCCALGRRCDLLRGTQCHAYRMLTLRRKLALLATLALAACMASTSVSA